MVLLIYAENEKRASVLLVLRGCNRFCPFTRRILKAHSPLTTAFELVHLYFKAHAKADLAPYTVISFKKFRHSFMNPYRCRKALLL